MGTRGTILLTEPVGLLYREKQVDAGWTARRRPPRPPTRTRPW